MLGVLGNFAEFERDFKSAREGARRENGKTVESYHEPETSGG